MKKTLTLLISSTFLLFIAASCNSEDYSNGYENGGYPPPPPDISATGVAFTIPATTGTANSRPSLFSGNTMRLTAVVQPNDATNQNLIWTTLNPEVASISNGVITGLAVDSEYVDVDIVVTTEDGNFSDTTSIRVGTFNCNDDTPLWGNSLGTVTWGNTSNTNINSGTTTITGTDGRPNQIWSGAVFASVCAEKTTFDGGSTGNFNADCRRAHTELTGHFFSWCAVVRFADQLCPYPWRVPTRFDFRDLDLNLGGTGNNRSIGGTPEQLEWYSASEGTGSNPQIGGIWGGARFTGNAGNPTTNWSGYWPQSENSATDAFLLYVGIGNIRPQHNWAKGNGLVVRCVR